MNWDPHMVRQTSTDALKSFGIVVPRHLPVLDEAEFVRRRSVASVRERARALFDVLAVVEGASIAEAETSLSSSGLDRWLSRRECEYFAARRRGDEAARDRVRLSWRSEATLALGWALCLSDELPLVGARGASPETFAPLFDEESTPAVRLRPGREIIARLDLFYCAHWAVVQHQLTGHFEPWPADLVPGAIVERRHALEWILDADCGDWDDVDLST